MRLMLVLGVLAGLLPQMAAPPGATLRGRVFDPDGRPFVGVEIVAYVLIDDGERAIGPSRLTAEDGTFEMAGLKPGALFLRATPRLRRVAVTPESKANVRAILGHPPVYYPGVLDRKDAWPIDLAAGETVEFDFHIPPVLAASIKASVSGPAGYTLEQLRVMRPASNTIRTAKVVDGVAYVDHLREGRHVVVARGRMDDVRLAAFRVVELDAAEVDVPLRLEPAAVVTGRIVAERAEPPSLAGARVTAVLMRDGSSLDPLPADHGDVAADGSFRIEGLFGQRAFRVSGLPEDWYVYAVRLGAADITSSAVDLAPGAHVEIAVVVRRK
ncbi:MAG TPA: carboxypeptidase-like regulatory domain-containing protein [Vicinamibacterales bacterium]|nr:carboxypeptidase-like regulatory domain-containing protein [Vicinamibacterales bacterium]